MVRASTAPSTRNRPLHLEDQQEDLVQHFGLGASCAAEAEVCWPDPDGTTHTVGFPAPGRCRFEKGCEPTLVE